MWSRRLSALLVPASILISSAPAFPHHGGGGHHVEHHGGGGLRHPTTGFGFGGGFGFSSYGFSSYAAFGVGAPWVFAQPFAMWPPIILPVIVDRGPLAGPLPMPPAPVAIVVPRPKKKADPAKGAQLVTVGDRLFRVGNVARAAQRYEQAVKTDPDSAAPRVRLAQVALVRGQFAESAKQIRDAVAAEPGWLAKARDIQTIYAEPADFHKQIGRLESRVLIEPGDRDAWLVLGAELYLSGQTRRASDIFVRLTDRKPDPALAAFLDASNTPPEAR